MHRLAELDENERADALATVESHLEAIRRLGGAAEGLVGQRRSAPDRSLAASSPRRRPSDDFVYVVDGQPVIAAWGYEADAAASLQAFAPPPVPDAAAAGGDIGQRACRLLPARVGWAPLGERPAVRTSAASSAAHDVVAAARLFAGRSDPEPRHAWRRRRRPPPEAPPDPTPVLKASLDDAQADENKLKAELAALRGRPQGQGRAVQADRAAQAAATAASASGQAAAAAAASAAAPAAGRRRAAAAPPVNRPPPGQLPCNWSGDSGGEGVTRNRHYLGDRPGFVGINYNLYVKPDDIKVIYRGQVLAGTGGPRSGRGGFGFDWKPVAGDYSVDVVVTGEMWGTRWTYAMVCPR